jgi:transcriptional regulator with XRE-family HTH domain
MDVGFGRLLRRAREEQGVSQERLAVRAGTSQAYISAVERGRVSPRLEQAHRLLRCLGHELHLSTRPMPMRSYQGAFDLVGVGWWVANGGL